MFILYVTVLGHIYSTSRQMVILYVTVPYGGIWSDIYIVPADKLSYYM